MKKSFLSLALALTLALLPAQALAAGDTVTIRSPEELRSFVERVDFGGETSLNAVLAADIDLSGHEWLPIALESHGAPYTGTFDGGGHTIANLHSDWYGFMGRLGEGGVIQNLTLKDVSITKGNFGFTALCQGRISDCTISGVMTPSGGQSHIGGIAADLEAGVIENCVSYLDITFDHQSSAAAFYVGGIVGDLQSLPGKTMAVLDHCAFHGSISVSGRVPSCWGFIGGVAGSLGFYGVMANCVNTGDIFADLTANEDTRARIGGVVGQNFHSMGVNCANTGDISVKAGSNIETACSGAGMGVVNAFSSGRVIDRSPAGAQVTSYANQQNHILEGSGDLGQGVSFTQAELTNGTLLNKMNDFLRKNPAEKYITPIPNVDVRLPDIQFLAWRQGSAGPELSASASVPAPVTPDPVVPDPAAPDPAKPAAFSDVRSGDWFADAVAWAVEKEITNGTTPTTFSPKQDCTVAHILTFLWRASGSPKPAGDDPFGDVKSGDWFADAAIWAHEKGMVTGDTFNPNAPCTRSMAVTYLWQAAGSPEAKSASFTDVPASADYAKAVNWAVEKGITDGTSATEFSPDTVCTRGHIVTFLYRGFAE